MSAWRLKLHLAVCLLLSALSLTQGGCRKQGEAPVQTNAKAPLDTLRISQRNEPGNIDPGAASLPDDFFVSRALGEGLLVPNPDGGEPLPGIAEVWRSSTDGRTYTFNLREARWSDGKNVTAEDFVYTVRRALSPASASPKIDLFLMIRGAEDFAQGRSTDFSTVGVRALDRSTLEIRLTRGMPSFPHYVATGPWIPVPSQAVEHHGRVWTRPGNHVSNGPYMLEEWRPGSRIVLRRNPQYWDVRNVRIPTVILEPYDNTEAEERAFRSGALDITMSVPPSKIESYRKHPVPVLRQAPLQETRCLSLNTRRPPLSNPLVRQALSMAINRRQLCERLLNGAQQPATRFLHPDLAGVEQPAQILDQDDPAAAQLLSQAGFPGGMGFPVLELSAWTNPPLLEALQAMWQEKLGIRVNISLRDAKMHVLALREGNYDIGLTIALPDVPDAISLLGELQSDMPDNYPHWSDPSFDTMVEQGKVALDGTERSRWIIASERRLLTQMPVVPLYFNTRSFLVNPRVRHWREDGLWNRYYKSALVGPDNQGVSE